MYIVFMKIGPASATGNTYPHRQILLATGWQWNGQLRCWQKARYEEGSLTLSGVTITVHWDLVDHLTQMIADLKRPVEFKNSHTYARSMSQKSQLPDLERELRCELALRNN